MTRKQIITVQSDLTGAEADETEAVSLIIRRGPGLDRPVMLDALPSEVEVLSDAPDIFQVEVKDFYGNVKELLVNIKDLKKLVADGNIEGLLADAPGTRGRRQMVRNTNGRPG